MSDGVNEVVEPQIDNVVNPESDVVNHDTSTPTENVEPKEIKTFTQEEVDDLIAKRLAREQRRIEREYANRQAQSKVEVEIDPEIIPNLDQDSLKEIIETKAKEIVEQTQRAKEYSSVMEAFDAQEDAMRDKFADYDQVTRNEALAITDNMAELIRIAPKGSEMLYYLGTNPSEALRIARLPEKLQGLELGQIAAKLATEPLVNKVSKAPAPLTPVKGNGKVSGKVFDTTDPRAAESMSTEEWIAAERERKRKLHSR